MPINDLHAIDFGQFHVNQIIRVFARNETYSVVMEITDIVGRELVCKIIAFVDFRHTIKPVTEVFAFGPDTSPHNKIEILDIDRMQAMLIYS
jgi:hypothetical protein